MSTVLVLWVEWLNDYMLDEQNAGFLKGLFGRCNSDFTIFLNYFYYRSFFRLWRCKNNSAAAMDQSINQSVFWLKRDET